MTLGLKDYLEIRKLRPAPVWSSVWTSYLADAEEYAVPIKWPAYVSPHDLPVQRPEAVALLEKARRRQELDKQRKDAWLQENVVDAAPYVERWDESATKIRDELLDLAVSTFPMLDGLEQANETIKYGLEMKEAEIDRKEFSTVITSLFRLRVFQWATERVLGTEDPALVSEVMRRVAAREIPTRDNVVHDRRPANNGLQAVQNEISMMLARQRSERKPFDPFGKRRRAESEL